MPGWPAIEAFVPQSYRVSRVARELADTVSLDLEPLAGARPLFAPGQFNMLYAFGVGEVAVSISGDCADSTRFVHTVRAVGAVSSKLAGLRKGETVGLRGPFGTRWPIVGAEGSDVLIVGGGLGLAPLRPAIYHVLANRHRYGRLVILFGTRNPESILYRQDLELWRQRLDVDIYVTVDHADKSWRGHVGVVPALIPRVSFDPRDAIALVCGPEAMMRFAVKAMLDIGLAPECIHLSMERNMKCAIGLCGHCQFGPYFLCRDGPVMPFDRIAGLLSLREL